MIIFILAISIEVVSIICFDLSIEVLGFSIIISSLILAAGSYFVGLEFYLKIINRLPKSKSKTLALSFDDGPNNQTIRLLKVLDKHQVKASFFCIGKHIEEHYDEALQIVSQGHLLGNHSYSHSNFFALFSFKKVKAELLKTNELIEGLKHGKNVYFRPPFGVTNPIISRVVSKLGMTTVGWSFRSYDTSISKERLLQKLKSNLKDRDIILLHDRAETIDILDEFITYAKSQAYEFVLISGSASNKELNEKK